MHSLDFANAAALNTSHHDAAAHPPWHFASHNSLPQLLTLPSPEEPRGFAPFVQVRRITNADALRRLGASNQTPPPAAFTFTTNAPHQSTLPPSCAAPSELTNIQYPYESPRTAGHASSNRKKAERGSVVRRPAPLPLFVHPCAAAEPASAFHFDAPAVNLSVDAAFLRARSPCPTPPASASSYTFAVSGGTSSTDREDAGHTRDTSPEAARDKQGALPSAPVAARAAWAATVYRCAELLGPLLFDGRALAEQVLDACAYAELDGAQYALDGPVLLAAIGQAPFFGTASHEWRTAFHADVQAVFEERRVCAFAGAGVHSLAAVYAGVGAVLTSTPSPEQQVGLLQLAQLVRAQRDAGGVLW